MKLITLLILIFSSSLHAEIYRYVDENGNVIFSDQHRPKSEKVDLPPITTYKPFEYEGEADNDNLEPSPDENEENQQQVQVPNYEIRIAEPENDQSFWANDGNVTVSVSVNPALDNERNDKMLLKLDGSVVFEPSASTTFQLNNLDRGTHNLIAMVVDSNGVILASSNTVVFHLHRVSIKNNSRPTPAGPSTGSGSVISNN